jgi:hypothetical protein
MNYCIMRGVIIIITTTTATTTADHHHHPQNFPTVFTTSEPSSQAHEWLLEGLPLRQPPPPAASS